jgi:hypothetical protein
MIDWDACVDRCSGLLVQGNESVLASAGTMVAAWTAPTPVCRRGTLAGRMIAHRRDRLVQAGSGNVLGRRHGPGTLAPRRDVT